MTPVNVVNPAQDQRIFAPAVMGVGVSLIHGRVWEAGFSPVFASSRCQAPRIVGEVCQKAMSRIPQTILRLMERLHYLRSVTTHAHATVLTSRMVAATQNLGSSSKHQNSGLEHCSR